MTPSGNRADRNVPIPAWRHHGSWSSASQEVHGIYRDELNAGMSSTVAIAALNSITEGHPSLPLTTSTFVHLSTSSARTKAPSRPDLSPRPGATTKSS